MKDKTDKPHKPHKFLKTPSFPGGQKSFKEFVDENLKYPEEAIKNNIQGTVYLKYMVDNTGRIENIVVTKGIGYGCDEEAVRLVKLISYPPVKNRGVRLKVMMKTRIAFTLPIKIIENNPAATEIKLSYTTPEVEIPTKTGESKPVYGYSITITSGS